MESVVYFGLYLFYFQNVYVVYRIVDIDISLSPGSSLQEQDSGTLQSLDYSDTSISTSGRLGPKQNNQARPDD